MTLKMQTGTFMVLAGLLLVACCPPTATPVPEPTDTPTPPAPTSPVSPVSPMPTVAPEPTDAAQMEPPEAALAAQAALAASLEVPVEEVEIVAYEPREWPDACLGLAREGEMCAQVITPGWRVVLSVQGEQYVFRTDESGEVVRPEDQITFITAGGIALRTHAREISRLGRATRGVTIMDLKPGDEIASMAIMESSQPESEVEE